MNKTARILVASAFLAVGIMTVSQGQASPARPITGYQSIDEAIYVLGITCGMGSLTAAKVMDGFILGIAPDLARGGAPKQTTAFGNMVQQLQKQDELANYGYKGPVRRFLDRYCIIGYLTGTGSCDN